MSIVLAPEADTIAIVPQMMDLAQRLAPTEFVPRALRNRPEAVLAAMLTGREIGLPPMQALAQINVIEGRPSLSAEAVRTLILARGHELWVEELTLTRCVLCGRRRGEERVHKATWTADDAQRAGLSGKPNWRQYPRAMLLARATGELGRLAFADVLGGLAYVTEEIQDGGFEEPREPPQNGKGEPKPEPRRTVRRRARRQEGAEPGRQVNNPTSSTVEQAAAPGPLPSPPEPPMPEPPAEEERARDVQVSENLSLAQQIAMACRQAGIDRAHLIEAITGKQRARDVTREEALAILGAAREIAAGRKRLVADGGLWSVLEVVDEPEPEDPTTAEQAERAHARIAENLRWAAGAWDLRQLTAAVVGKPWNECSPADKVRLAEVSEQLRVGELRLVHVDGKWMVATVDKEAGE